MKRQWSQIADVMYLVSLYQPAGYVIDPALITTIVNYLKPSQEHADQQWVCDSTSSAQIYNFIRPLIQQQPIDILVRPYPLRPVKLLLADMESTVIEQEMLDELAAMLGIHDHVAAITHRAMNGELDFAEALQQRVALFKGQPVQLLHEAAKRISFMAGAEALLAKMKSQGAQCWLVTGGFDFFAEPVARQLGFDRCYANVLGIKDGLITGEVASPILDKVRKREILLQGCAELGVDRADCMAMGDGANDLPMLMECNAGGGFGVAYHAKPVVREAVPHQLNHVDWSVLAT